MMLPVTRRTRRRHFARAFVLSQGNASAAARSVGYSATAAHVRGHRLLQRPDVLAYIAEALREADGDPDGELGQTLDALTLEAVHGEGRGSLVAFDRLVRFDRILRGAEAPAPNVSSPARPRSTPLTPSTFAQTMPTPSAQV